MSASDTPTPRTDAHMFNVDERSAVGCVMADFARQLERELNEAKFILGNIIEDLPKKRDWLNPDWEKAARAIIKS